MNIKLLIIAFLFLLQGCIALYQMTVESGGGHISFRIDSVAILIGLGLLFRLWIAQIAGVIMAACFLVLCVIFAIISFSIPTILTLVLCVAVIFGLYSSDVRDELR